MSTPLLELPYIQSAQAQKHMTHNEALRRLDACVQLSVRSRSLAAPPRDTAEGERFLVAEDASGAWAGQAGRIAARQDGAWAFLAPRPGWLAHVEDEAAFLLFDGAAWQTAAAAMLAGLERLGVNAATDATNRFAVRAAGALFNHDGADHRLTINKAGPGDTASIVFQEDYAGRAEIGLAGAGAFVLKTSADGTIWRETLRADPVTGACRIGGVALSPDILPNLLPDSGRFNGNDGNGQFQIGPFVAPSYLAPLGGTSFAAHAKFVYDNADYGGTGAALDADVAALLARIRPPGFGRYGPEWFAMRVTAGSDLAEPVAAGGETFGLPFTNTFIAMPQAYTLAYHLRVLSGRALVAFGDGLVVEGRLEGDACEEDAVIDVADGWRHVMLAQRPNGYGYNYRSFQLLATADAQFLIALPAMLFGHALLPPQVGLVMNARLFD